VKRFKVLSTLLLTFATASGAFGLSEAGAAQSGVGTHASTRLVTIQISSTVAHPGSVVVQNVSGTVLATCQGPKAKGTTTCAAHLPSSATSVFVAQAAKGVGVKSWAGACGSVPGPVCALYITSNKTKVLIQFGGPSPKTAAVPTLKAVEGDTSGCSGYLDAQTVNATGLTPNVAVTLKDDGHLVTSGTTSGTGTAQLNYTTLSEPGVYRILAVAAGNSTAKTDVYNAGSVCSYWNGIGTGTVNFKVEGTDFDSKSKVTIRFGTSKATFATTDSTGAFVVTTPNYSCKAGTTVKLDISAIRGARTRFSRTFDYAFSVVC
jgi:hypothetical protein